jgi:hypothetical protein
MTKPITVICAWCGAHKSGPPKAEGGPVSHGMCHSCYEKEYARLANQSNPVPSSTNSLKIAGLMVVYTAAVAAGLNLLVLGIQYFN